MWLILYCNLFWIVLLVSRYGIADPQLVTVLVYTRQEFKELIGRLCLSLERTQQALDICFFTWAMWNLQDSKYNTTPKYCSVSTLYGH